MLLSPSQIDEESKAASLGIVDLPALVYFESNVPHLYKGDLRWETDEQEYNDDKIVLRSENDQLRESLSCSQGRT